MNIEYEIMEIKRALSGMIRLGSVKEVQADPPRVKVAIGKMVTDWRRWMEEAAGEDTTWDPPSEGEQVLALSPFGDFEQAVILRGLNQTAHPAPETDLDKALRKFGDGSLMEYDRASHTLTLEIKGPVHVTAEGDVTVTTKGNADVTADGDVNVTSKGKATVKADGGIDLNGDGSGAVMGCVVGGPAGTKCPLTGQGHFDESVTVSATKG